MLADRRFEDLFRGVLTVINLVADPEILYHHYRDLGSALRLPLPDGTPINHHRDCCSNVARRPTPTGSSPSSDQWFEAEDTSLTIRIFENIIKLLFAPGRGNYALGGGRNGELVIETDGGLEPVDVLKICGPGFTSLGLNVHRDEIRDRAQWSWFSSTRKVLPGSAKPADPAQWPRSAAAVTSSIGQLAQRIRESSGAVTSMELITHVPAPCLLLSLWKHAENSRMQPVLYSGSIDVSLSQTSLDLRFAQYFVRTFRTFGLTF